MLGVAYWVFTTPWNLAALPAGVDPVRD